MKTLWVGNFAFEDQLRSQNQPTRRILNLEAALSPCLAGAASPEDFILCSEKVDSHYSEYLSQIGVAPPRFVNISELKQEAVQFDSVEPWGWSPSVLKIVDGFKFGPCPSLASVAIVNSRLFSFQLSAELNCQLQGELEVRELDSLDTNINHEYYRRGYVLKTNFGQSGRGQLLSCEQSIGPQQRHWVAKKLKTDGALYLEPRLDGVAEFGVQWDISCEGDVSLFGVARLHSDQRGQYSGSVVGFDHSKFEELDEIIEVQRHAVRKIQQQGYFGPVGIDAMIYLDQTGSRKIRPLQDINARWTMGRLAIHWAQRCFPGASPVCWTHASERPSASAVLTSPKSIGGLPTQYLTWCHHCEAVDV